MLVGGSEGYACFQWDESTQNIMDWLDHMLGCFYTFDFSAKKQISHIWWLASPTLCQFLSVFIYYFIVFIRISAVREELEKQTGISSSLDSMPKTVLQNK